MIKGNLLVPLALCPFGRVELLGLGLLLLRRCEGVLHRINDDSLVIKLMLPIKIGFSTLHFARLQKLLHDSIYG